ncbi:MAG: ABC transporter ATP-binding protein [Clostridiales bacterium]
MNGMQDIRINKAEEITNNIFKDHVLKLLKNKQKARFLEIKAERLNGFFTVLFTLSFWILSAIFVINNKITVGTFFIIEKYFNILINNIDNIKQAKINYHNFQPSFERLLELCNYNCENSEYESSNNRFLIRDCPLLFENVVFHYTERPIINHLNIKIEKGEFLSIVGANGAGKSTLFGLIIKFFDVKHGCIKLKDYNINDIPTKELRSQIGYVQQNTIIFEGTLEDNLKLYNNKVTKIEMWEVLKQCGLYETIIKWDDGLKTDLMNGDKLSGGQKQRISFARLLIKNPEIILMDEPTSALDNDMEWLIIKDIKRIFERKTLIIISHRPIPVYAADKIAVLHDGKFIDIGTNIELMERCRIYRQMFSNNFNQSGDKEYVF